MQFQTKEAIQWCYDIPLTSGGAALVPVGRNLYPVTNADVSGCRYLTWSLISSHACRLEVFGDIDAVMGTLDTLYLQNVAAGILGTPYNLAAPVGQGGDVILTKPYLRLRLSDQAAANHTYTRFYAIAWW